MIDVHFRFYAELNDLLPASRRGVQFPVRVDPTATIKHAIESLGVPHTEVDLILVNGHPVDFQRLLHEGDRVSVYPVFESFDITPLNHLRPVPLRQPSFILDMHLGRLAAFLRMLGFDTHYSNRIDDPELAQISLEEHRILLTRDRGLLKRNLVTHGYCVRSDQPRTQVEEVLTRFDLYQQVHPFTRCMRCNALLQPVEKSAVAKQLQPNTLAFYDEFQQCPSCSQVYWKGSHHQRMQAWIAEMLDRTSSASY